MTYKFNRKNKEKIISLLLDIITIGVIISIFIFDNLIISIVAFIVSAFAFYCTRSIARKNKSRIKNISIIDNKISINFFYKSKAIVAFNKSECTIALNQEQVIFSDISDDVILGIANKADIEITEEWNNLISDLKT